MLDLDKKGELGFLIDFILEEAQGQCRKCALYGEPTKIDEDGTAWHLMTPGGPRAVKPYYGECRASALIRVLHHVRDKCND